MRAGGERSMTQPTTDELLNAAVWTYQANPPNGNAPTPLLPADLQPLTVNGAQVTQLINADGFFAGAFVTPQNQVVIAVEGTSPSQILADTEFGRAQIGADALLYYGITPNALSDALSFTNTVEQDAAAMGIGTSNVFLAGHSLGAGEVEYVAAHTGLGGESFGTPGLPQSDFAIPSNGGLTDYIERGDPVGNYAADSGTEGNFLYSQSIVHYGQTQYLGDYVNSTPLYAAGYLFGKSDVDTATALGIFATTFATFHPTKVYAASLGVNLTNPSPDYNGITALTIENILGANAPPNTPSFLAAGGPAAGDVGRGITGALALAALDQAGVAAPPTPTLLQSPAPSVTPSLPLKSAAPAFMPGDNAGHAIQFLIATHQS
jgi:hypothetical protein